MSFALFFSESGLKVGGEEYRQRSVGGNDRNLEILVTDISSYLAAECQNRSENLTNRKLWIFYIEAMYQLFFQLQRKNIFFRDQKKIWKYFHPKIFSLFFWSSEKNKISFFEKVTYFFSEIFLEKYFWAKIFSDFFLILKKNIFSLELEKKLVHNFDV